MNATVKATNAIKWIDALKGKNGYKKGINSLGQKVNPKTGEPQSYCCLGVGCKVLNVKIDDWGNATNEEFAHKVGLDEEDGRFIKRYINRYNTLVGINDEVYGKDKTFTNMRKYILNHIDNIFIPPVAKKLKQHYGK